MFQQIFQHFFSSIDVFVTTFKLSYMHISLKNISISTCKIAFWQPTNTNKSKKISSFATQFSPGTRQVLVHMKMVRACVPAWWPMQRMVRFGKVGSFVATQEFGEAVGQKCQSTYRFPKIGVFEVGTWKGTNITQKEMNHFATIWIFRRYSLVVRRVDPARRALAPSHEVNLQWLTVIIEESPWN